MREKVKVTNEILKQFSQKTHYSGRNSGWTSGIVLQKKVFVLKKIWKSTKCPPILSETQNKL